MHHCAIEVVFCVRRAIQTTSGIRKYSRPAMRNAVRVSKMFIKVLLTEKF
jgi:hypothetical protein